MEPAKKKPTRDEALIGLLRENITHRSNIKSLEKAKVLADRKLKKLEESFDKLQRLVTAQDKDIKAQKEKTRVIEGTIGVLGSKAKGIEGELDTLSETVNTVDQKLSKIFDPKN